MTNWNGAGFRLAATLLGATMMVSVWWVFLSPDPSKLLPDDSARDPRLTFDTPFRNVRPDVCYVGDAACAPCHLKIDDTYHRHPMGQSAAAPLSATSVEDYRAAAKNPFRSLGHLEGRIERQPGRVLHHIAGVDKSGRVLAEKVIEPAVAIGSGTRGRSYLYVHDGHVWQSPISWFSGEHVWDISPGFQSHEHFQRPVDGECLYCHTHRVEPVSGTQNKYHEPVFAAQIAIGCERCHGPGQMHVAERSAGFRPEGVDTSIVNPKHLSPELRQSICQQCHLQGETRVARRGRNIFEFRPGLPLDAFVTTYVKNPGLIDYSKSVGQFEQMSVSTCFISSGGKLECISCHDPHGVPSAESKAAYFRGKCLNCHGKEHRECKLPAAERSAERDSCVACHMTSKPSANIAHASVTDHRIPRFRPKPELPKSTSIDGVESPLVAFGLAAGTSGPAEDRDLGIALAKWAIDFPASKAGEQQLVLPMAQSRLESSLKRWPRDVPALEALAQTLAAQGQPPAALQTIKKVLALEPMHEPILAAAVKLAVQMGDLAFAEECAEKLVEMNPNSFRHRMRRALTRMELRKYAGAVEDFRAALSENPTHCQLRAMLAASLRRAGDLPAAQHELKTALDLAAGADEEASVRRVFESLRRAR